MMDLKIDMESQLIYERMDKDRQKIQDKTHAVVEKTYNLVNTIRNQKNNELFEMEEMNNANMKNSLEKNNHQQAKKHNDELERKRILSEQYEKQIKFKHEIRKNEEIQDKELAKYWKNDYENYLHLSKNKNIKYINEMKKNNEFLMMQMEGKKLQKSNDMSIHEFKVNKEIIANLLKAKNENSNLNF